MNAPGPETVDIAVIGAGLAGLTCAYRMEKAGMEPTVFEASARVGGRVWTHHDLFDTSQYAEGGGQFINSNHEEIQRLVAELELELVDLKTVDKTDNFPLCIFDGRPYTLDQATADFEGIRSTLDEHRAAVDASGAKIRSSSLRALDALSITEYMERYFPGGPDSRIGKLLRVVYQAENGAPAEEQSSLNMINVVACQAAHDLDLLGTSDERYTIHGGCQKLPDAIEAKLRKPIRRQQPLISIQKRWHGGYLLAFASGLEIVAEKVVLTLPFSVLRASVDISAAGFSALKRTAIQEIGMGSATKLHLHFDRRIWADAGASGSSYSDSGYQSTWDETRGQPGPGGIMVAFAGGANGLGRPSDISTKARNVLGQLESAFPGISHAWTGRASVDSWVDSPFSRGSYSFRKPGQNTKFGGSEAWPEGNCHFAGEHTSEKFFGYMNGAVASGERAAQEILMNSTHESTRNTIS